MAFHNIYLSSLSLPRCRQETSHTCRKDAAHLPEQFARATPIIERMSDAAEWGSDDGGVMWLRRTHRGWEEVWPDFCAGCGAPMPDIPILVGIQACSCNVAAGHRTLHHNSPACGVTTYVPDLGHDCVALALDERTQAPTDG